MHTYAPPHRHASTIVHMLTNILILYSYTHCVLTCSFLAQMHAYMRCGRQCWRYKWHRDEADEDEGNNNEGEDGEDDEDHGEDENDEDETHHHDGADHDPNFVRSTVGDS